MTAQRPLVLFIVDRPGWAHDRKTDALTRELSGEFAIVKRFQRDVSPKDIARADCVLFYYWMQIDSLGGLRSAIDRGKPVVAGICSHVELEGERRRPGLATLERFARTVFVNNRLLFGEFRELIGPPVIYTPNGVDTDFYCPLPQMRRIEGSAPLRVGWAGSLSNHGPDERGVHEYIAPAARTVGAELCLAVREERWRSAGEMLDFYRSIDVYVCASRSEGTPNPCLEAAACGVPVVSTPVGNMPELIRDGVNGFLVSRDAGAFAERLAQLRDEPELRARMGRAARAEVAEAWDWRLQARRYRSMLMAAMGL